MSPREPCSVSVWFCISGVLKYFPRMSFAEVLGLVLAGLVMFIGLAGSVLPGIPGAPLILIGAVGHKLYCGERERRQDRNVMIFSGIHRRRLVSGIIDLRATCLGIVQELTDFLQVF